LWTLVHAPGTCPSFRHRSEAFHSAGFN
jgi:hypothetical protein